MLWDRQRYIRYGPCSPGARHAGIRDILYFAMNNTHFLAQISEGKNKDAHYTWGVPKILCISVLCFVIICYIKFLVP